MFFSLSVRAQQPEKFTANYLLKGRLVDADSGTAVTRAHITNLQKNTIAISDMEGSFTLHVSAGDTLMISRIGYITQKVAVPLQVGSGILKIQLSPKVEELQEVVISQFPSERKFKEKLLSMELPEDKKPELNVPHPSVTREIDPNAPAISMGGIISGFANKFNDKERGRQFKARMEIKAQREAYIATKFNKEIVQQITGLKAEEELDAFMKYCVLSEEFLYDASEYKIHEAVLGCFKDFVASR